MPGFSPIKKLIKAYEIIVYVILVEFMSMSIYTMYMYE